MIATQYHCLSGKRLKSYISGWTYCVTSECGEYIKIGRTRNKDLNDRISSYQNMKTYAQGMSLSWAINGSLYETPFHHALDDYRCNIVISGKDKGIAKTPAVRRNISDHFTFKEACRAGLVRYGSIDSNKAIQIKVIELFHITPIKAKIILKKAYPQAFE